MSGSQTQLGDAVVVRRRPPIAQAAAGQAVQVGYVNDFLGQGLPTGNSGLLGRVYEFQLYNSAGTLVADPVFSSQTAGRHQRSPTAQGNTWTLERDSAALDDRCYRFHGEMSRVAESGRPVQPRRLLAGHRVRRAAPPQPGHHPRAVGDAPRHHVDGRFGVRRRPGLLAVRGLGGQPADRLRVPRRPPMYFSGTPDFQEQAGSPSADSVFACSAQLPTPGTSRWQGAVSGSSADWGTYFLLSVPSGGLSGDVPALAVVNYTSGVSLTVGYATAGNGTLTLTLSGFGATTCTAGVNGQGLLVEVFSTTTEQFLNTLAVGAAAQVPTGQTASMSGNVVSVLINPAGADLGSAGIGHIFVSSNRPGLPFLSDYLNAWTGETAANRVARLCVRERAHQPHLRLPRHQRPDGRPAHRHPRQPVPVLRGHRHGAAVRAARNDRHRLPHIARRCCNQSPAVTADYSMQQVSQGFADTADDLLTLNDVIASNADGSSPPSRPSPPGACQCRTPPSGIGPVSNTDRRLPAVRQPSFPAWPAGRCTSAPPTRTATRSIPFQMARSSTPQGIPLLRTGDYLQITNTPYWIPPPRSSSCAPGSPRRSAPASTGPSTVNGIPESPYEVAAAGSALAESSGTALATGYSSSATSFSVDVTGALWATGACSINVMVAGEEIEITGISGASSPQTFTVTRSVNGVVKSQSSGAAVVLAPEPIAALV